MTTTTPTPPPTAAAVEPRLSATDALLACAAAQTPEEMHQARLALIETGADVLTDLDRDDVVTVRGTGDAGCTLLGTSPGWRSTIAGRSFRIQQRLHPDGGGSRA